MAQQGDGQVTVGSFNVPHIGETHTCQTSPGSGGVGVSHCAWTHTHTLPLLTAVLFPSPQCFYLLPSYSPPSLPPYPSPTHIPPFPHSLLCVHSSHYLVCAVCVPQALSPETLPADKQPSVVQVRNTYSKKKYIVHE